MTTRDDADVIADQIEGLVIGSGWDVAPTRTQAESIARQVIRALAGSGFAVVKLPEPDHRCDRDAAWVMPNPFDDYEMQVDADKRSGITIADLLAGGVYGPWTPETACWIGAALIAAAHSGMAR